MRLGVDPVELARALVRARQRALGGDESTGVRAIVGASWQRALNAGVDPDRHDSPLVHDTQETRDRWAAHPLHRFIPLVQRLLGDFAYDAQHMVVMADADGCIVWTSGHPKVLSASESISFCPGHDWREQAVGTNGVGTALALDHPVQIFSAEHYNVKIQAWSCSGAPIHDPRTGAVLGVVDVSSGIRAAHPHSLALVSAAADAVESILRGELERRRASLRAEYFERAAQWSGTRSALVDESGRVLACHPGGWLSGQLVTAGELRWLLPGAGADLIGEPLVDGAQIVVEGHGHSTERRRITLKRLDGETVAVEVDDRRVRLSPRHSELLEVLIRHPEGLSARELATELFDDPDKVVAARAEISRLRRQLVGLIATRPYRLLAELESTSDESGGVVAVAGSAATPAVV